MSRTFYNTNNIETQSNEFTVSNSFNQPCTFKVHGTINLEDSTHKQTVTRTYGTSSNNTIYWDTCNPQLVFHNANVNGIAYGTNDRINFCCNGVSKIQIGKDDILMPRFYMFTGYRKEYEILDLSTGEYNITASSPKSYVLKPGTTAAGSIRFSDNNLVDGTIYSIFNMSNGSVSISETIDGAQFYQNLTDYNATVQPGVTIFTLPRYWACHIKVCKISNSEIYFFVNMTPNST